MKLYNTLSRSIEVFKPQSPPAVSMYVCGPTVYDVPHIGHARSAYTFDLLRHTLTARGYQVTFVRNVTDVDDKIIDRAKQEFPGSTDLNAACRQISEKYLQSYHDMLDRLGILPLDKKHEPKATEHVDTLPDGGFGSMTDLIGKLLTQGAAYEAAGDVYFAVRKFPGYGKLSNRTLDDLQAGTRVEPGEGKQDPMDFALWKRAKPGEPSWKSPWGPGRPGWHIECSAMSTHYLGDSFDIHGGGVDLIFPHHENEVAQAQAAGKPFANTWVHNGLLTVNGEKMSKSLKNYTTVEDALKQKGNSTEVLKYFFLGTHYRSPIDYSKSNVEAAGKRFARVNTFLSMVGEEVKNLQAGSADFKEIAEFKIQFYEAMDNDVNTPEALAVLDGLVALGHQWMKESSSSDIRVLTVAREIEYLGQQLGVTFIRESHGASSSSGRSSSSSSSSTSSRYDPVRELFDSYIAARARKDFAESDALRQKIQAHGFIVQDMAGKSILVPKE